MSKENTRKKRIVWNEEENWKEALRMGNWKTINQSVDKSNGVTWSGIDNSIHSCGHVAYRQTGMMHDD